MKGASQARSEKQRTLGFIGAGTVGTALAVRLSQSRYPVIAVYSRSRRSAQRMADAISGCTVYDSAQTIADNADVTFITTPDDAIGQVASSVRWRRGQGVIHCSGADSVAILEPARQFGALVGGFHPLQTFASVEYAIENTPGSTFAIEAEEPLLTLLQDMATALGGRWVRLTSGNKVLYHAAAVIACNYLVTLTSLSTDLWHAFGVQRPESTQALLPLLRGTLNNIEKVGLPDCLTGPIARGDIGTIDKHIKALQLSAPDMLPIYCDLGLKTIPIALAKGKVDEKRTREITKLLKERVP